MTEIEQISLRKLNHHKKYRLTVIFVLFLLVILVFFLSLFVGSSNMSFVDGVKALFGEGTKTNILIMQNIRLPRVLAGLIAGFGLAASGHIMQSSLNNPMASPSTLGVSNAAVLGANIAIIVLSGGYFDSANGSNWNSSNPYVTVTFAFLFALGAMATILALSSFRGFQPNTVVLAGIALGSLFSAVTTLIQYFATDTQLASAVYWTFGDLGRATYQTDWIMLAVVSVSTIVFFFLSKSLNVMQSGDESAKSLGINPSLVRFICLFLASLIAATCISFLGIIGFLGIIAPQVMKRIVGEDHRYSLISSCLFGSLLLILSDTLARALLQGTSLPVGAITSILGAPFFLYIIFSKKEKHA
jgi:iron complex transport system permease protein